MASSPISSKTNLLTLSVNSNGSPIKDTFQVLSAFVSRSVNEIPYCEIELADGNPSTQDFPISESDTFVPGAEIELLAGYENKNETIFKGIVIKHRIRISSENGPVLHVVCKDKAVKMTAGRKNAYFKDTTDGDIMSQLIGNYGLKADVSSTPNQLKETIQHYATDWDFMVARADINGMITIVEDGKVSIKSPDDVKEEPLELTYGKDILEFDAEIDAQEQYKSVKASAWDYASQAITSGESTTTNFEEGNLSTSKLSEVIGLAEYPLQSSGPLDQNMLSTWAKAKSIKSKYSKIRGTVTFQGSALAAPGTLIGINGLGKRFNGKGFISGLSHEIANGNWLTTVQLGLSTEWFTTKVKTEASLAAGLLPGIQGLQIGKVKQINEDPDSQFRVLITLPLIQSSDEGVWARLSSFYATSNAGAFFYPEVDDEVIVGFLNDDPRYPVILGSVYSSGHSAPESPGDNNNIKAFVSREKMKLAFDEENKIITITTPSKNQLVFSDEGKSISMKDQNNNFIKLSSKGIEINSASNVKIVAAKSITMEGPQGITSSASNGSISLNGNSIKGAANMELSLKSNNMATFHSVAQLSINSAMVKIN